MRFPQPDAAPPVAPQPPGWPRRFPVYYGWVSVTVAACAMAATLPGRTHGLGLITERLLDDLSLARTTYAQLNLVCTLLGAAFCLPVGLLIDRCGVRLVLTFVVALLGASVLAMAAVTGPLSLAVALLLVRGLGQSALSVVSIALVGKWFRRRLGAAMGVFSILLTFGFIAGVLGMGTAVERLGWREAWTGLGLVLLGFAPLCWLLARDSPAACGLAEHDASDSAVTASAVPLDSTAVHRDFTLSQALRMPVFWVFSLGTAIFNLVWSAITLFNESLLAERGFVASSAIEIMAILTGCGLVSNVIAGRLATRERMGRLLGTGLTVLSLALAAFPAVHTLGQLRMYAVSMGLTGGLVTVVFFAAWGHLFGQKFLGRIQAAAQVVAVLASASGPLLLAECQARTGSYAALFTVLSTASGLAALAAFLSRPPRG
ncbi:MAG: MFS transporter [Planctomycetaceae bacterium]|nr:MFS transporter [Planctomycetaceae bacterium]